MIMFYWKRVFNMKKTKISIFMVSAICTVMILTGCFTYSDIESEEFIDTVYKVCGETIDLIYYDEGYYEASNNTNMYDGLFYSTITYRLYDDSEDASMLFEEYCNEFLAIQEENEDLVRIDISDGKGYIVFDDNVQQHVLHESGENVSVVELNNRRYGCIYYYDNVVVVISSVEPLDAEIDQTIELLDELGLPHM